MKKKYFSLIYILITSCLLMACNAQEKPVDKKAKKIETKIEKEESEAHTNKSTDKVKSSVPPEQIAKAKELIEAAKGSKIEEAQSIETFKKLCSICHGKDGNMVINGSKDLSRSKISLEESVAQIYFGKGLMTPYKGVIPDEEIVLMAKYLESFRRK